MGMGACLGAGGGAGGVNRWDLAAVRCGGCDVRRAETANNAAPFRPADLGIPAVAFGCFDG